MLLGLEALHGLDLLVIHFADVDEAAGDKLAQFGLVRLEAEESHLLGGLGALEAVAVGVGLDGAGKDELGDRVVVGVENVLAVLVVGEDDMGLDLADLADHALAHLVGEGGLHGVVGQIPELDVLDAKDARCLGGLGQALGLDGLVGGAFLLPEVVALAADAEAEDDDVDICAVL